MHESLHPRLRRGPVEFLLGVSRYQDAVRAAFQAVEDEIRDLAQTPTPTALDLIAAAFAPQSGALTDQASPANCQEAMQRLFLHAFRRHANPSAPYDRGQAVEALLLADLLIRELDTIASRLQHRRRASRDRAIWCPPRGGSWRAS